MFKMNCIWLRRVSPYQQKRERKILVVRDSVEPRKQIFNLLWLSRALSY